MEGGNGGAENPPQPPAAVAAPPQADPQPIANELILEAQQRHLNEANSNFFGRMSLKGRDIFRAATEKAYDTPMLGRVVGKMGVTYNQFWANRHESNAAGFKNRMDAIDLEVRALNEAREELERSARVMEQANDPGYASLLVSVTKITQQQNTLLAKKDKAHTKFETSQGRAAMRINERDAVADKLIRRYEEKLRPLEGEVRRIEEVRTGLENRRQAMQERHRGVEQELAQMEARRNAAAEALRRAGNSEWSIGRNEGLKAMDTLIINRRRRLSEESELMTRKLNEVGWQLAKSQEKANPARDRREWFVRKKSVRETEFGDAPRNRMDNPIQRAEVHVGEFVIPQPAAQVEGGAQDAPQPLELVPMEGERVEKDENNIEEREGLAGDVMKFRRWVISKHFGSTLSVKMLLSPSNHFSEEIESTIAAVETTPGTEEEKMDELFQRRIPELFVTRDNMSPEDAAEIKNQYQEYKEEQHVNQGV